jgi:hypothetical protein
MSDRHREKIRTGVIIERLHRITEGKIMADPQDLSVQVRAALGLLAKTLPDLQRTEHTGDGGGPLTIITRAE